MTEDEAKTKTCPQTLGRTPANPEACIGSACMAWQETTELRWFDRTGKEIPNREPYSERGQKPVVTGGFCGLARSPQ